MHFIHPVTGATWTDHVQWRGVFMKPTHRFAEAKSDTYHKKMQKLMREQDLPGMPRRAASNPIQPPRCLSGQTHLVNSPT